jgi:transcriptional regulator with XRE-family HTH domain
LEQGMSKELGSALHEELREFLREQRFRSKLKQAELAARLGWSQQTVSKIESGQKRVTVVELMELSRVLRFNPKDAIDRIAKIGD